MDIDYERTVEEQLETDAHVFIRTHLTEANYPVLVAFTKNFTALAVHKDDSNKFMRGANFPPRYFSNSIPASFLQFISDKPNAKERIRAGSYLACLDTSVQYCLQKWLMLEEKEAELSEYINNHALYKKLQPIISLKLSQLKNHASFWPIVMASETLVELAEQRIARLKTFCRNCENDSTNFEKAVKFLEKFIADEDMMRKFKLVYKLTVPYSEPDQPSAVGTTSKITLAGKLETFLSEWYKKSKQNHPSKADQEKFLQLARNLLKILVETHSRFLISVLIKEWESNSPQSFGKVTKQGPQRHHHHPQQQEQQQQVDFNELLQQHGTPPNMMSPSILRNPEIQFLFPDDTQMTVNINGDDAGLRYLDSYVRFGHAEKEYEMSFQSAESGQNSFEQLIGYEFASISEFEEAVKASADFQLLKSTSTKAYVKANSLFAQAVCSLEKYNTWKEEFLRKGVKKVSLGVCVSGNENNDFVAMKMAIVNPNGTIHPATQCFLARLEFSTTSFNDTKKRLHDRDSMNLTGRDNRNLEDLSKCITLLKIEDVCIANRGDLYVYARKLIEIAYNNIREADRPEFLRFAPAPNYLLNTAIGLVVHRLYGGEYDMAQSIAIAAAWNHTNSEKAMASLLTSVVVVTTQGQQHQLTFWDLLPLPYDCVYMRNTSGASVACLISAIAFYNDASKIGILEASDCRLSFFEIRNLLNLGRGALLELADQARLSEQQIDLEAHQQWMALGANLENQLTGISRRPEFQGGFRKFECVQIPTDIELINVSNEENQLYNELTSSVTAVLNFFPQVDTFTTILQQHGEKLKFGFNQENTLQILMGELVKHFQTSTCARVVLNAAVAAYDSNTDKMKTLLQNAKTVEKISKDKAWNSLTTKEKNTVIVRRLLIVYRDFLETLKKTQPEEEITAQRKNLVLEENSSLQDISNILKIKIKKLSACFSLIKDQTPDLNQYTRAENDPQVIKFDHNHTPPVVASCGWYRNCKRTNVGDLITRHYEDYRQWTPWNVKTEGKLSLECQKAHFDRSIFFNVLTFMISDHHDFLESISNLTITTRKTYFDVINVCRNPNMNGINGRTAIPYSYVESTVNQHLRRCAAAAVKAQQPYWFARSHLDSTINSDFQKWPHETNKEAAVRNFRSALVSAGVNPAIANRWRVTDLPDGLFQLRYSGQDKRFMQVTLNEWRRRYHPVHLVGRVNALNEARMEADLVVQPRLNRNRR